MSVMDSATTPPTAAPTVAPGLDLADIDDKIRHTSAIQSSWGLPPLPDEVILDLVTKHDKQGLGAFLYGLAGDVNRVLNPLAAEPAGAQTASPLLVSGGGAAVPTDPLGPTVPGLLSAPEPAQFQLAGAFTDVAGFPRPEVVSSDAVFNFKRKAIGMGLLPANTSLDARWDGALNGVAAEVRNEEFRQRLAGNRSGAWSIQDVTHLIDEWTAPSNLLNVARRLDFIPDVHAIGRETHSWGDKWRKLGHELTKGGWKSMVFGGPGVARAFMDAVTGPIDDVAVPILNDALLVTGVSEVIGGARALAAGAELAPEVTAGLKTLYSAKTAYRAGEATVAGTREAGLLSSKLVSGGGRLFASGAPELQGAGLAATRAGEQMAAWRNLKAVKLAGVGLGRTMQLGIIGNVEQKLFSGQNYVRTIEEYKDQPTTTSPLGNAFDLLSLPFAPAHVFSKGTFTQLGRPAAALADRYRTVAKETGAAVETARAWGSLIEDPEKRAAFQAAARRNPAEALIEHLGGDHEKAGHLVAWAATLTAVDADGIAMANRVAKGDPARWKDIFLKTRNARISQLRHIDEGDEETFLQIMREKGEHGGVKQARRFRARLQDPERREQALADMNALITDHQAKRDGAFQGLLDGLQPGMIEAHVSTFFKHESDWDAFLTANDTLRQMTSQEGLLDAAPAFIRPFQRPSRWRRGP